MISQCFSHDELLTAEQVADLLKLRPKTIYAWVSERTIPHFKIGRAVRFRMDELAGWLENQKQLPIGGGR